MLRTLTEQYGNCWTYAVDGLVGATPEMLVRVTNGLAEARVLAGTLIVPPPGQTLPGMPTRSSSKIPSSATSISWPSIRSPNP